MLSLEAIVLPLAGFSLEISAQLGAPVTGLFGPSGSGKTSLLDLVAGLRRPQSGMIRIDDTPLTDVAARTFVPPRQRGIGYVPQDLALFPHLHVRRNLLYGCRDQGGAGTAFSFDHITDVLEIRPLLKRDVGSLSGGEQQRVALARALLSSPRLLLLDEPLSSLDGRLKSRLIPYFQRIRDEFHVPMIYVTHDPVEIEALCDEVVRLECGQIVTVG